MLLRFELTPSRAEEKAKELLEKAMRGFTVWLEDREVIEALVELLDRPEHSKMAAVFYRNYGNPTKYSLDEMRVCVQRGIPCQ